MRRLWGTVLVALLLGGAFAQAPEGIGEWVLHTEVDPFTDAELKLAFVTPTAYPTGGRGDMFGVVCGDTPFSADGIGFMLLGSSYISTSTTAVTYRVDAFEAVSESWRVSDRSVLPHRADSVRALTAALLAGEEKLAIKYGAYSGTPTYSFPISGFREALRQLGCYEGEL